MGIGCSKAQRFGRLLGGMLGGYRCGRPRSVDVELTTRCNLRCKMCWFHGERGVGDRFAGEELRTDEVRGLVDELARENPRIAIYLGGAEPFVRTDFLDIVRHVKRRRLAVSFTTNGTLVDAASIETLVALGVDGVNFSLDGDESLHDELRGSGAFRKVTSAILELAESKASARTSKPTITVNVTVTSKLVGQLARTLREIRAATQDGADSYRIHHRWYVTPAELSAHQAMVRSELGCHAPGAAAHLVAGSPVPDLAAFAREVESLRTEPKISSWPDLRASEILTYYGQQTGRAPRCFSPFMSAIVRPNGDVTFCPDEWIDDYVLGNVRAAPFAEIWNGARARRFRSVLARKRSFPACRRCSWL